MYVPGKVESVVVIIDPEDCNVSNLSPNALDFTIMSLLSNFPNSLDELFIIDPPLSITIRWNQFTGRLPEWTTSKIQIVSRKKDAY